MRTELFNKFVNYVAVDTETTDYRGHGSLDWRTGGIALIQININDEEIKLLRPTKENLLYLRKLLGDSTTLTIMHNAKFDLKFLANLGVYPKNLFDTQIASELLYAGLTTPDDATKSVMKIKQAVAAGGEEDLFDVDTLKSVFAFHETKQSRFAHNLATALYRELGILIPKDMQQSDWAREPLSDKQVEYAENDVRYLITLASILYGKLVDKDLEHVALLEMEFIKPLAYLEFVGVKIDVPAWKEAAKQLKEEVVETRKKLELDFGEELAKQQNNVGLFGIVPIKVNINSSKQMAELLHLPDVQAATLDKLDTSANPLIKRYVDYKKREKLASTYGEAYLRAVGADGRLRSSFMQLVATGRLSSRNPNLQNVPAKFIKSMIRANDGYIPVQADYSQAELRIAAYLSNDPKFIEATTKGDLHAGTARQLFNIPDEEPVPSDLRKKAKCVHQQSLVVTKTNGGTKIAPIETFIQTGRGYDEFSTPKEDFSVYDNHKWTRVTQAYTSIPEQLRYIIATGAILLSTKRHKFVDGRTGQMKEAQDFSSDDKLEISIPEIALSDRAEEPIFIFDEEENISLVMVNETIARILGRYFDDIDTAFEKILEVLEFNEWAANIIINDSFSEDSYIVPRVAMNSAPLLKSYFSGVKTALRKKDMVRQRHANSDGQSNTYHIPINDKYLVFFSQLIALSRYLPTSYRLSVLSVDENAKIMKIVSGKKLPDDNVEYVGYTNEVYLPVDFSTESHTFVVNNVHGHNTVNFGIPYGVSAHGLVSRGFFDNLEEADRVLNQWKETFSVAWRFLKNSGDTAARKGYSRDAIGRWRRYEIPRPPAHIKTTLKELKSTNKKLSKYKIQVRDIVFEFDTYEDFKEFEYPNEVYEIVSEDIFKRAKEIKKYEGRLAAIQRQGQNMPIQATSATVTKQALVDLYEEMLHDGRFFPVLTIHDSIFFEVKKTDVVEVAEKVKQIMENAGPKVVDGIVMPVDVDYGWLHTYKCVQCGADVQKFTHYVENGVLKEVDSSTVLCDSCKEDA